MVNEHPSHKITHDLHRSRTLIPRDPSIVVTAARQRSLVIYCRQMQGKSFGQTPREGLWRDDPQRAREMAPVTLFPLLPSLPVT